MVCFEAHVLKGNKAFVYNLLSFFEIKLFEANYNFNYFRCEKNSLYDQDDARFGNGQIVRGYTILLPSVQYLKENAYNSYTYQVVPISILLFRII